MIEVSKIEVWGWEHTIRGMRNPMNSWDKSDSGWEYTKIPVVEDGFLAEYRLGPNDLDLMKRLYRASLSGDNHAHRKFMRQICVSMDINAPLYWWKEADTYKIGTTANSCSTMHKIHSKEFVMDDFSHDQLTGSTQKVLECTIRCLNELRHAYLRTKDKSYWYQMIQLLPSSYNQLRTITFNYEVALTIINQRTGHKLNEWNEFVKILHTLPSLDDITQQPEIKDGGSEE